MRPSYSRRRFLQQGAAASILGCNGGLFAEKPGLSTLVHTRSGPVRGAMEGDVRVFRGVPFAAPPVGALRFRPPVAAKPWSEVLDCTAFSASPMQPGEPGVKHSEDCLYLNVWAPAGNGPFPVFVWIHGGGFVGGHAFEAIYNGAQFAREGVLCLTVAYRLGVFGFLDVEPLLGAAYSGSANNALHDLIASLTWVQANIEAFGGDPRRVTIGGESAGAKLTDVLMGLPSAQPLFSQMISESGGAERIWSRANAAAVGRGFGTQWTQSGHGPVTDLRTAPANSLIQVQKSFMESWPAHFPLRAEVDGTLIPRLPIEGIAGGLSHGKRLLIGSNRDESALFVGTHPVSDATAKDLGNLGVAQFQATYAQYNDVYPAMTAGERRIRALTAEEYWVPSIRVADAHVRGGGSAWMYELTFAESSGTYRGFAYHSLDVGLVWDKPHKDVANASEEAALATEIHAAWVSFIQGNSPAAPGLPAWPAYEPGRRATMMLSAGSRVEDRPQEKELQLWQGKL